MSKRAAETQITKDMNFNFSGGGGNSHSGGPDDVVDPVQPADPGTLAGRKIAPLKRRGAGRGAGGRTGAAPSIPNMFAGVAQGVQFGAGGANGAPSPSPAPSFAFGNAPSPPIQTSFGNGTGGGFSFGQTQAPQQEQPKANPFAGLAPPAPANGTNGVMFGNPSSGSFGSSNAAPTNGMFGNANGNATSQSFGGFGTTTTAPPDKPATSGFSFGGSSAATAPSTGGMFGNASSAPAPFSFGAPQKAEEHKPATSGFNFGVPAQKTEEPKPAASGFAFGQTSSAAEPAKPAAPSFLFSNPSFGAPAAAPAPVSAGFGSGLATDAADGKKTGGFSFGATEAKAAEAPSMFAKPPVNGGFTFGAPKDAAPSTSMFGNAPGTSATPMFGFPEKKDEAKPMFGAPTAEKKEEPKPAFGGFGNVENKTEPPLFGFGVPAEKKEEPAKPAAPLFGFGAPANNVVKKDAPASSMFGPAPTEKKEEPKSMFGSAPSVKGFSFGAPKPADKPAATAAPSFTNPSFGPGTGVKAPMPKPISFSANPFGFPPSSAATTTNKSNSVAAPTSMFGSAPATSNSSSTVRLRSPPLPADSHKWSTNQLTDYYNLFALRSLNHSFKEELAKQDIFADLTPICDAYVDEVKKIKELMEKNQRYKFGETSLGSGVPGKRTGDDNDETRGGKRRALGEEPKVTFASASSPKSSTSQALASVLGSGNGGDGKKGASPPKSGGASVFDNPSSAPSAWVNPFKKADTTNMPDDPEPEYDDEEDENPKKPLGGSIFGFSSAPKDDNKSSLFSNGADKTWSPDTGIKFSTTGLFPPATANGGGMFGGATAKPAAAPASSAGFFGSSKPTPVASVTTSASASESEDPSDVVPPHKNESNLSQQGPGEEDEDSLFQAKSVFYAVVTGGPLKKEGAGMLRVLKNRITGKGRVVIRTDVGKVLLNVGLAKDVKYVLQDNGLVRIPQFKEDGVVEKTWGIKVKDQKALREAVEKGKGE